VFLYLSFYLLFFNLPPYSFPSQVKSSYFLFIFLLLGSLTSTSYLPHFTGSRPLYHASLSSDIPFLSSSVLTLSVDSSQIGGSEAVSFGSAYRLSLVRLYPLSFLFC
jgi:hypothetical protein